VSNAATNWVRSVGDTLHRSSSRGFGAWITQSPVGLVLLQIPLVPILLLRAPSVAVVDLAPVHVVAKSLLTAATLWFTMRPRF
jgi:hypothetical protein